MVGALLTTLTLAVLQLAIALHVRNTVIDAAAEGARFASLADARLEDGVERTHALVAAALGEQYPIDVDARVHGDSGVRTTIISVRATLPVIGLLGFAGGLDVTGHAVNELAN